MSHRVEIQVIEDKLLLDGIADEKLKGIDFTRQSIEFNLVEYAPKVETLELSFKRISRIENLVGFENLIKLCLDNNLIEEITNLSHLTKLKWLDLSFNKIRRIQGLEHLTQLDDLSLYSNKISIIEGLEKCTNLQCLSLGMYANNLADLSSSSSPSPSYIYTLMYYDPREQSNRIDRASDSLQTA
jgi:Leucine-rich repeat (LRR) protein